MAKHTPGPWRVQTLFYKTYIRSVANDDEFVATVEMDTDAHLLAAAPDLLEACKAAKTLIEDMARFVGVMALKNYALFNEAPIALSRAIAKAERKEAKDV